MDAITILDVSPRDGLQNESKLVSTPDKLRLIEMLSQAGFKRIEIASFVNPAKVPQMADAAEILAARGSRTGDIALALNAKGVERAIAAKASEINYVFAASEGFSIRNAGVSIAESLKPWPQIVAQAKQAGIKIGATISTAFGCPFDGEIAIGQVLALAEQIARSEPFEITLGDTIGVAVPSDVRARFDALAKSLGPDIGLRAHFHNTRNTAIANAIAAFETGVRVLDGSIGGIGGCPFAPGATGNVASEDLVYVFERMGIATGIDLPAANEAAQFMSRILEKTLPGMVSRAPIFPPH